MAQVKNRVFDYRDELVAKIRKAQEEIKTTACLVAAWIVGSVIGIVGGILLFA